jgi:aryl-alcohol dehydrogenase-like predicted oxidoreductase
MDETMAFASGDIRNRHPRFSTDARRANQRLVEQLTAIATAKSASAGQIALAWLLARKPWIVPIPGTTKQTRLRENVGAADVELTAEDLRRIGEVLANTQVQGERYPPDQLARMSR